MGRFCHVWWVIIIKKLLLTQNSILQYDFLDIAYDILESTHWVIAKARASFLSNNERFDLMFTFVKERFDMGGHSCGKQVKLFYTY